MRITEHLTEAGITTLYCVEILLSGRGWRSMEQMISVSFHKSISVASYDSKSMAGRQKWKKNQIRVWKKNTRFYPKNGRHWVKLFAGQEVRIEVQCGGVCALRKGFLPAMAFGCTAEPVRKGAQQRQTGYEHSQQQQQLKGALLAKPRRRGRGGWLTGTQFPHGRGKVMSQQHWKQQIQMMHAL